MLAMEGGGVEPPLIRRFKASLSQLSYPSSALSFPMMKGMRPLHLKIVGQTITRSVTQGFRARNTQIQYNPYDLDIVILKLFVLNGTRERQRLLKNEVPRRSHPGDVGLLLSRARAK